ncbi:MAG TPA: sugar ABC transporter permease [Chloroflexia bacterium]|nr:sugar ABC transporter permease [Chloroflexia bacterium]
MLKTGTSASSPTRVRPWRVRLAGLRHDMTTRQARAGYLFILPSLVILAVFVFWPIVQSVILSLEHWRFGSDSQEWAGLDNYNRLLGDERVWGAFRNTLYYTALSVPLSLAVPLALALALNRRLPGRALLRSAFFLPVIGSFAIVAIIWTFLLDPDIGLLSYWLAVMNIPVANWLRDPTWAMPAVIAVSVWKNLGFNMVIFLAGLQGISPSYYEAAAIDGASSWSRFWKITLPLLRPTALFVLVVSVIGAFQVFDPVYVMTPHGGPLFSTETVVTYIYHQGIELVDISYAASIGVVLFLIVFALTLLQLRVLRYRDSD